MFGVDIANLSVKAAMGEPIDTEIHTPSGCYATHNLHSRKNGIYMDITFDEEIKNYIYRTCLYKRRVIRWSILIMQQSVSALFS